MSRVIASALVLLLLFASAPFASAQLSTAAKQWSKGDFSIDSKAVDRNFAKCSNPSEKKDGKKHVVISSNCTELAGVTAGRNVKLKATLVKEKPNGKEKKLRNCDDKYVTTGTPGEFTLECRIKLVKAAR